jgi:hypothetical protein
VLDTGFLVGTVSRDSTGSKVLSLDTVSLGGIYFNSIHKILALLDLFLTIHGLPVVGHAKHRMGALDSLDKRGLVVKRGLTAKKREKVLVEASK